MEGIVTEGIVNIAGSLIALVCSMLLYRSYVRTRARLSFCGAICFLALAVENAILFIDLFVFPETSLSLLRYAISVSGIGSLIFALIWDVQ